ncbi:MAG: DUF5906 domain-containing protein [Thermoplasmata archaeon]
MTILFGDDNPLRPFISDLIGKAKLEHPEIDGKSIEREVRAQLGTLGHAPTFNEGEEVVQAVVGRTVPITNVVPPVDWIIDPPIAEGVEGGLFEVNAKGEPKHPDLGAFVETIQGCGSFVSVLETDRLLVYRNGVYVPDAETRVAAWVEHRFRAVGMTAGRSVQVVIEGVRNRSGPRSRALFNPDGYVCVANGVIDLASVIVEQVGDGFTELDLSKVKLLPHTPEKVFTWKIPVVFDPFATAERFSTVFIKILPEERERRHILEAFGYSFFRNRPYKQSEIFCGPGDTGKSVLLNLLRLILGSENVSTVPLQMLESTRNRFASAQLVDKIANIATDLGEEAHARTGNFKTRTGDALGFVEEKGKDGRTEHLTAKEYYSCNTLPEPATADDAYFNRWNPTEFTVVIPRGEQIENLETVLFNAEAKGILNLLLEGYARLKARGRFDRQATENVRIFWMSRVNPLAVFIEQECERGPGKEVEVGGFIDACVEYALDRGRSLSPEAVGRRLGPMGIGRRKTSERVHGTAKTRNIYYYTGISLKVSETASDLAADGPQERLRREPEDASAVWGKREVVGQVGQVFEGSNAEAGARARPRTDSESQTLPTLLGVPEQYSDGVDESPFDPGDIIGGPTRADRERSRIGGSGLL